MSTDAVGNQMPKKVMSWHHPAIIEKKADGTGRGLFAAQDIPKGEILIMQAGKILDTSEIPQQYTEEFWEICFQVEKTKFICPIDSTPESMDGAFLMNHSCDPTCGLKGQITFVALRDIRLGEQITFDYAMTDSENSISDVSINCRCGTALCRGLVGHRDWKNPKLQERYRGYFSSYVQEMIDESRN